MDANCSVGEMEEIPCPLCGSDDHKPAYSFSPYKIVKCRDCGFYFLSPRLKEVAILAHYQGNYFSGDGYNDYGSQELALRATFKRFIQQLHQRKITGGRLLEIGCGYGYLLDEAKPFFSLRHGTDFSESAVARSSLVADHAYLGGLNEIPSDAFYDCIIATHVIEHVYDPVDFLRDLIKHLSPRGRIVIAAPDMGSFWRKIMGRRWPSFILPAHLQYFDKKSLTRCMKNAGLEQPQTIPYPHAFPVTLVAAKLGIQLPSWLNQFSIWLPATTVAISCSAPESNS